MSQKNNLAALKTSVVTMGIILIFGTIALFIAVAVKFQSSSKTDCSYKDGGVSVSSEVVSATTKGNMMTLLTSQKQGVQEVMLIDLCQGTVISRFLLNDVRFTQ